MAHPLAQPVPLVDRAGRAARRRSAWFWVLAVAALFSIVQLPSAPGPFYPDSTQYLLQTYDVLGETAQSGRARTIEAYCEAHRSPHLVDHGPRPGERTPAGRRKPEDCAGRLHAQTSLPTDTRYGPAITPGPALLSHRYEDIFLSRPAVAVFYAPGVAMFGARMGMWVTTLAWTLLGSVLVFLLLRVVGTSLPAALLGQVLFLVLPVRESTMAPLAEGMTLTLVTLCLYGVAHVMVHRWSSGLPLLAAGFGLGLFVKYSQFLLLAVALAGTAVIAAVVARRAGRPVRVLLLVAGLSSLAAVVQLVVARLLDWPGASESMQDLFTRHFRDPDVTDPVLRWVEANLHLWTWWIAAQLRAPLMIVSWGVAAWGVLRSRSVIGFAVFAAVLAGLGNQMGLPNPYQGDRLFVVAWLLVVLGLPLLVDQLARRYPTTPTSAPALVPPSPRPSAEWSRSTHHESPWGERDGRPADHVLVTALSAPPAAGERQATRPAVVEHPALARRPSARRREGGDLLLPGPRVPPRAADEAPTRERASLRSPSLRSERRRRHQ